MCHRDRSRQQTAEQTANTNEETDQRIEQGESPSRGIVEGPVRALKRAYALIA